MTALDQLLGFARDTIDPKAEPITAHTALASGPVLRAATRHGPVIIKLHRTRERHDQEVHAYRHWTGVLGERAPRLLAEHPDPPMVILSALPGHPAAFLDLAPDQEHALHAQAGSLLRMLHLAEPCRPDTDIAAWLCERGERRLALAAAILPAAQRAQFRAHLRALAALGPLPTVPCHLDFTPRNLLRDEDGTVRLIDFEHARHDLAARDLVRFEDRIWKRRPELKAAFLDTYGQLSDVDHAIIEHATHLDHLTAAVPLSTGEAGPVGPLWATTPQVHPVAQRGGALE